ncbi:EpsG family protein [Butyrivibrio sp. NC3005]|uniref:EpsG family protein n=1 Tax=Butyrivibrio sp. NC3005 TaxID=1280685 RepID=UPI0004085B86|nr:EpsG family protein [Butyrivibrio sp. NC3005]
MWLYFLLTAVTLFLAFNVREDHIAKANSDDRFVFTFTGITRRDAMNIVSMVSIFIMLFAVSALRLNVGNDYAKYVNFMHLAYVDAYVPTEIGFNLLAKIVYSLCGFENYLLVFAFFSFFTMLFFLWAMKELSDAFRWTFMMFMLLSYYFQSLSTVRYYLALSIALFSIRYIRKKDYVRFVVAILLGSLFHKSVLVTLIIYPLCIIKWKRWMGIAAGSIALTFVFCKEFYLKLLLLVYPSYKGTEYLAGGTSIVSIVRILAIGALVYLFYKDAIKENVMNIFYVKCNFLALLLYVFCSFLPVISRIGYYLTITQILLVPSILVHIKSTGKRHTAKIAVFLVLVLFFLIFMFRSAAKDGVRILPYETFMFHDMVPLEYQVTD